MVALVTSDPSETAFEVAAVQEFTDHFRDDGAQRAKLRRVLFRVNLDKLVEVAVDALPQRRLFRISDAIELHPSIGQYKEGGVPSNGTGKKRFWPRKGPEVTKKDEA